MGKKLVWLGVAACLSWLSPAFALSLGSIQIQSSLNQPLLATIPLLPSPGEQIDDSVIVRIASNADYTRAGIERIDFLSDIRLELGDGQVLLSSIRPVPEPYFDLLLEVKSSGGRLLRQYTLLLDPQGSNASGTRGVVVAKPQASNEPGRFETYSRGDVGGTRLRNRPAVEDYHTTVPGGDAARAASTAPSSGARTYGPVKAGETPASIAARIRSNDSVTLDQVIVALFQENPTAFGKDLTSLRAGSILRIPSDQAIGAVDPDSAKSRIASARSTPAATGSSEPASPKSAAAKAGGAADSQPEVVTTLSNEKPAGKKLEEPASTPPPTAESATGQAAAEAVDAASSEGTTAATPAEPVADQAAQTEPLPEPELTIEDGSAENRWIVPVVVAIAALLLFWLAWRFARSRSKAAPDDFKIEDVAAIARPPTSRATAPLSKETPEFEGETASPKQFEAATVPAGGDATEPPTVVTPPPAPKRAPAPAAPDTRQTDVSGGDVLAEADFHLAYGLYDEAILLLTQVLAKDPARTDIRLKLAETYFSSNREAEFLAEAHELHGKVSDTEWDKIMVLGRQLCPDDSLFKAQGAVPVAAGFASAPATQSLVPVSTTPVELHPGAYSATPAAAVESKTPAPAGDTGMLEFSMDDFNAGATSATAPATASAPATVPAAANTESVDLGESFSLDEPLLSGDENSTKLELAQAYVDLGDTEMARSLLGEVIAKGSADQRKAAESLTQRLSS